MSNCNDLDSICNSCNIFMFNFEDANNSCRRKLTPLMRSRECFIIHLICRLTSQAKRASKFSDFFMIYYIIFITYNILDYRTTWYSEPSQTESQHKFCLVSYISELVYMVYSIVQAVYIFQQINRKFMHNYKIHSLRTHLLCPKWCTQTTTYRVIV